MQNKVNDYCLYKSYGLIAANIDRIWTIYDEKEMWRIVEQGEEIKILVEYEDIFNCFRQQEKLLC